MSRYKIKKFKCPLCEEEMSCGKLIKHLISHKELADCGLPGFPDDAKALCLIHGIEPPKCPECGRYLTKVSYRHLCDPNSCFRKECDCGYNGKLTSSMNNIEIAHKRTRVNPTVKQLAHRLQWSETGRIAAREKRRLNGESELQKAQTKRMIDIHTEKVRREGITEAQRKALSKSSWKGRLAMVERGIRNPLSGHKPAHVYLLKLTRDNTYYSKVGVSSDTFKYRCQTLEQLGYTILQIIETELFTRKEALSIEQKIKVKFDEFSSPVKLESVSFKGHSVGFSNGGSEFFSIQAFELIKSYMDTEFKTYDSTDLYRQYKLKFND